MIEQKKASISHEGCFKPIQLPTTLKIISFGFILNIFIIKPKKDIKMTFAVAHIFIFCLLCFTQLS